MTKYVFKCEFIHIIGVNIDNITIIYTSLLLQYLSYIHTLYHINTTISHYIHYSII